MKNAIIASLLLLGSTTAGAAVTFTTSPGAPDPGVGVGETVIDSFSTGMTGPAGINYSGSYTVDNLSVGGFRAAPAGDNTAYFGVPGTGDATPGTATIDFTGYIAANRALRSVSFYWGSVDTYNTLEVLNSTGVVIQTLVGSNINSLANGNQTSPATNQRLFLRFGNTDDFAKLRFTSTQRAFEIDDIGGSAVPEPATWAMLLSGMALTGFAMRRRVRLSTVLN